MLERYLNLILKLLKLLCAKWTQVLTKKISADKTKT
jgi:hypothetical protein